MNIPPFFSSFKESILTALQKKDAYTYFHCLRVGLYSKMMAQTMGLDQEQSWISEHAGLFHDIGKIGIPDDILTKPARLNHEEEEIMKAHPMFSADILKPFSHLECVQKIIPGVLHHHERIDGKGYPEGISGNEIPLASRIILIVDTYDAMTTTRPYRNGMHEQFAFREIHRFAGSQFDAHLAELFLRSFHQWEIPNTEALEELTFYKKAA